MTFVQAGELSERCEGTVRFTIRWRIVRLATDVLALMLVVVTVEAEQLPVAAVWRIVLMVVIFVVDSELFQLLAVEFSSAVRTDPREYFQRARSVGWLVVASYHTTLHT